MEKEFTEIMPALIIMHVFTDYCGEIDISYSAKKIYLGLVKQFFS